ncbi:type II secretion system F family protein [Mycolicibacterium chlorophenolicum]|nr:type II secretion system F family protein [Mycolicibacterium chlorophenolicum]
MMWAAALLAAAVLALPRAAGARIVTDRRAPADAGARVTSDDPLAVAATLDLLAACLRAGMAVSTAAAGVAASAPAPLAAVLQRAADLLALGADAGQAWGDRPDDTDPHVRAFLRMARRSAASGAALAQGVEDLAVALRADAADAAGARAERASVLIAGPLGLCYLPAFLCLGIVPVVAGLAADVLRSGVL